VSEGAGVVFSEAECGSQGCQGGFEVRSGVAPDDNIQLRGALSTLPPDKLAAWQCFWLCPRCGCEKAMKFREEGREWVECPECEYYEEARK